jgi:serine/threonine protein kinase
MVTRLELVHKKGYLHRDLKPQNMLAGVGKKEEIFYLIDFGLAKRFIDPKTGEHISFKKKKGITGTPNYLSLSTHRGCEHSRRDDLESLCLCMIYFLRGSLPWDIPKPRHIPVDIKDPKAFDKRELNIKNIYDWKRKCLMAKKNATVDELCDTFPVQFSEFFKYCRDLDFEETPDYDFLKSLLKLVMVENEIDSYDHDWAWVAHKRQRLVD